MTRTTIDFGIDLGTTNSCIAVLRGTETEVIKNSQQSDTTPSAVAVNNRGRKLVGQPARNLLAEHPDWGFQEFKRQMGADCSYRFPASGESVTPEQLSADVLQALRQDVAQRMSETIEAAVITIPAIFKNPACEATRRAAQLAGIDQTPLLQEPVAAALAYGFQARADKVFWLVYDLGGGTFDAAVIQVRDGMIQVVNHGGSEQLGGKDLDLRIVDQVLVPAIYREFGDLGLAQTDPLWRAILAKLKSKAEEAKIALSSRGEAFIEDVRLPGNGEFEYRLTRADVEREAEPIVAETILRCRKVLAEKRLGAGSIEKILLVGGPTLMPYLRQRLADPKDGLGIPLEFSIDPLTVVAKGAAVFAGTQPIARRTTAPLARGTISLELEFSPVGTDLEPVIGGKATAADSRDFRGFTVEFVRPGWDGGKVALNPDGTFYTSLFAEPGARHEFEIRLLDAAGNRRMVDPDKVTYTVGLSITEQLLTSTIGVALATGEFHALIPKGTPLPAKRRYTYRNTVAVDPRDNSGAIVIPLIQGEDKRARRNHLIGALEIAASQAGRPVPVGSDVEILLEVDASQTFHLTAYVPILDEEFPATYRSHRPTPDLDKLCREYLEELDRIDKLTAEAAATGEKAAQAELAAIRKQRLVEEIQRLLEGARADRDALERAQGKLLDLQIALDSVEEALHWPVLVNRANEEIKLARRDIDGLGNDEDRREARELERELKAALEARDTDVVRDRMEALSRVRRRVLARQPEFWVGWYHWCEAHRADFRDPVVCASLFARGNRALQDNNPAELEAAVRELLDQLPDRRLLPQGFGSTLARAD